MNFFVVFIYDTTHDCEVNGKITYTHILCSSGDTKQRQVELTDTVKLLYFVYGSPSLVITTLPRFITFFSSLSIVRNYFDSYTQNSIRFVSFFELKLKR